MRVADEDLPTMRSRLESTSWARSEFGRTRNESISQPEISPTLMEVTTIYEKIKKGRDNEIYRLSKFGVAPPPELPGHCVDEDEAIPMVPSFPNNLSDNQAVKFLDFNKFLNIPIRKYLYFSADTNTIQSDTLEGLSPNYKDLLKSEYYWLNITDPNESDLAILFNSFNVHDFTIADIRETNTEEKIEFYQHYTFMSTRLLREVKIKHEQSHPSSISTSKESFLEGMEAGGVKESPAGSRLGEKHPKQAVDMDFNILLFKNFVITMHDKKWASINDILGFLNLVCMEAVLTPDWVLYSIFIELAQDAQYLLGGIEPKINELRVGSTSNIKEMSRVLRENYEMEFQLYAIQRFVKPKANILRTMKMKCGRRFGKILLRLLNEIRDDFVEMNNDLRNLNHMLERSQDTFLALVSVEKSREANEMSLVMKRISQIALIFLPIQAISGFFGMNVLVPWQDSGTVAHFWIIVAIAGLVAVVMYLSRSWFLKKLSWGTEGGDVIESHSRRSDNSVSGHSTSKRCGFWCRHFPWGRCRGRRNLSESEGGSLPNPLPIV